MFDENRDGFINFSEFACGIGILSPKGTFAMKVSCALRVCVAGVVTAVWQHVGCGSCDVADGVAVATSLARCSVRGCARPTLHGAHPLPYRTALPPL